MARNMTVKKKCPVCGKYGVGVGKKFYHGKTIEKYKFHNENFHLFALESICFVTDTNLIKLAKKERSTKPKEYIIPPYTGNTSKVEKSIIKKINSIVKSKSPKTKNINIGTIKGLVDNHVISKDFKQWLDDSFTTLNIKIIKYRDSIRMKKYRDEHTMCEKCLKREAEHVHHIVGVSDGGLEQDENYLALCRYCHSNYHPEIKNLIMSSRIRKLH